MQNQMRVSRRDGNAGFTAMEALVSVVIMAILVLSIVTMFQASNKISSRANSQGDSQQAARVAMDTMTRDMRAVGFDLDVGNGQRGLVHAAPWDIIFNANVRPVSDDILNPGFPRAMSTAAAPATVPPGGALYAPPATYLTGAETIRFTLDTDGDGALTDADLGDDAEEASPNPRDFALVKEVYGMTADGTNGGDGETVGIVRGPVADPDGTLPPPLFQYWLDHDDDVSTDEILWGDGDGDGQLSQAEIAGVGPVPGAALALVTRVVLTVTGEDEAPDGTGDYRTRSLVSSVSFRNLIRRTGIITGFVYQDEDANGEFDRATESPIPGVSLRLSTGAVATSAITGRYVFEVAPGSYSVTELDPPGYESTTPNVVGATVNPGATLEASFGDRPMSGVGIITGAVFHDHNQNGLRDPEDGPLDGVLVTLHTGQSDTTDTAGVYSFTVPVGSYTVVELDPEGFGSTTPNAVDVVLTADGDIQHAYFGDVEANAMGTLKGLVWLDENGDGHHDPGEPGIPDVPVVVSSGDSTVTDGNGLFQFAVPAGLVSVYEWDLPGYTSSTPNLLRNVPVQADSTVIVGFGDIYDRALNFTIVTVGTTDRALSIASTNLKEDVKGDPDILLGTQITGGAANLHGWHNDRKNSGTPIAALFTSSPQFSRTAGQPIPAMILADFNRDGVDDLLTGLDWTGGNNLQVWITSTVAPTKGELGAIPTYQSATIAGSTVLSIAEVTWPGWNRTVFLVGTETSSGTGRVEVWADTGGGALNHTMTADLTEDEFGALGPVTAIATGDFDRDGFPDVAIGQDMGSYRGRVSLFEAKEALSWSWQKRGVLHPDGAVLSLAAIDMKEDSDRDVDLLVGTALAAGAGSIELWTNDEGNFGVPLPEGRRGRSDWIDAEGEVLSLGMATIDPDVFPDVVAGLRTAPYAGALKVYRTNGFLPSTGTEWSNNESGEVVTLTMNDFNIDGLWDIAVGTRTASTTGELVVYFGQ